MKKLFISCPMKGRTEENIRKSMEKMHRIAEIVFDQELEVISTYIPDEAPENTKNRGVWYLGKSIEMLSEADFFIGVEWADIFEGCNVESEIASRYGIRRTSVNMIDLMPDVPEVIRNYYEGCEKSCVPVQC